MQLGLAKVQNEGLQSLNAYRAISKPILENKAQASLMELVLEKMVLDHH